MLGIYAITRHVHLYDLTDEIVKDDKFILHDKWSPHIIGSMVWGCASTADHLFVSSEPIKRIFTGAHKVYDVGAQKPAYEFDAEEAGDGIAIDQTGWSAASIFSVRD